jgi:2-polyprenyl-3-methyl-5-hydroxy-6-metoxy-1,4-benzoquinol methylase
MLSKFIALNAKLSFKLSDLAERIAGRRNGLIEFLGEVLPSQLKPGMRVLDVGGGKFPAISTYLKQQLALHVTGLDIAAEQLEQAPPGSYDETIVGDVATAALDASCYDLIVSVTVLEHVRDNHRALANLGQALAPDGVMLHFVPCGNAPFARVNALLGHRLAKRVLYTLQPSASEMAGFPSYYDHCTPRQLTRLLSEQGLTVAEIKPYYFSEYLRFCVPLYAVELARQLLMQGLGLKSLAEAFAIIARKPTVANVSTAGHKLADAA